MSTIALHTSDHKAGRSVSYEVTIPANTATNVPVSLAASGMGYFGASDPAGSIVNVDEVEIKRTATGAGDPRVGGSESAAAPIEQGEAVRLSVYLLNHVYVANPDAEDAVVYVTVLFPDPD